MRYVVVVSRSNQDVTGFHISEGREGANVEVQANRVVPIETD
jgi:hypothetical protein